MHDRLCQVALLLLISILLDGALFMTGGTLSCTAPHLDEHLVGDVCTAETISMGTTWSWSESMTATPAQKVFHFVVGFAIVAATIISITQNNARGFAWFNRRVNFARPGPTPNHLFLPYLFATHGL